MATEKISTWKLHAFRCWLCPLWSPKEPVGTYPLLPSSFGLTPTIAQGHQHLYGSSLHTCLAPSFYDTIWGTNPLMAFVIDKEICIHEFHKTAADKESIVIGHNLEHLPWIFPRDSSEIEQVKMPISHSSSGRGVTTCFTSSCLMVKHLIINCLGTDCHPPQSLKVPAGTSPILSLLLQQNQATSICPEGVCLHL